jgi:hypothetical protein
LAYLQRTPPSLSHFWNLPNPSSFSFLSFPSLPFLSFIQSKTAIPQ